MTTLYQHAGGDEALHRLEEIFYSNALADPVLQPLFRERRPHHVEHLTWFTAESFGGPPRFTERLASWSGRHERPSSGTSLAAVVRCVRRGPVSSHDLTPGRIGFAALH